MAIHSDTASMLKESTLEMLYTANYCISYRKGSEWEINQFGGCLGYPAAIILFSIVDTIGSFYEGNKNFKIQVDGKNQTINNNGFEHFYILNSNYFNQNLSGEIIKKIYQNFRSLLTHNLTLPPNHCLSIGDLNKEIVELRASEDFIDIKFPVINLVPFLEISKKAVSEFIKQVDSIVPISKQQTKINSKCF